MPKNEFIIVLTGLSIMNKINNDYILLSNYYNKITLLFTFLLIAYCSIIIMTIYVHRSLSTAASCAEADAVIEESKLLVNLAQLKVS